MADIAMLVAEEYERRVKNSKRVDKEMIIKKNNANANANGVNFGGGSFATAMADMMMKIRIMSSNGGEEEEKKMDVFVKWVLEPKSQIGLAASDGFFSA